MSGQDGFTLIELMIVTLIVGLLAAIAIPRLDEMRARAYFSTIGTDLRNLGASQERYYQMHYTYAPTVDLLDFDGTNGVLIEVTEATATGWAAVATHLNLEEGRGCSIYLGDAVSPPLPDGSPHSSGPGVIQCAR